MDNYPEHLAPEFDEGGAVVTPFEEWWPRVSASFPHVPEEVAREWLHRHWEHSPFGFLASNLYRFTKVVWPATELHAIRWNWNNFGEDHAPAIEHGRQLVEVLHKRLHLWVADYLTTHGRFPSPPIIVDNRGRHVADSLGPDFYPAAYLLVEGHRRYAMASYLASEGRMKPTLDFWLMTRRNQA